MLRCAIASRTLAAAKNGDTSPASSTFTSAATVPAAGATSTVVLAVAPDASTSVTVPLPRATPFSDSVRVGAS